MRATVARMLGPTYACDAVPSGASALVRLREAAFELRRRDRHGLWASQFLPLVARAVATPLAAVGRVRVSLGLPPR